jgi:hypothetical protein
MSGERGDGRGCDRRARPGEERVPGSRGEVDGSCRLPQAASTSSGSQLLRGAAGLFGRD